MEYLTPQPFIVIDQNCCRDTTLVEQLLKRCQREGLSLLLPDTAIYEFSKGPNPYLTWRRSLELLSKQPSLVAAGRSIGQLMAEELATGKPCIDVYDAQVTPGFRDTLADIAKGDDAKVNAALAEVAKIIHAEKSLREQHSGNKHIVETLRDEWKRLLPESDLRALRSGDSAAYVRILAEMGTATIVFQALKNDGCSEETAYHLTSNASVYSHQVYCLAALALDWVAQGGLESIDATAITNDFFDIDYVCTSTFCVDLATRDKRAIRVYQGLTQAFPKRWEYIQMLYLIESYRAGPQVIRTAVAGMTQEQLTARPIPGKWSTMEVICHLADFEIVYADRIKRVIAENEPTLFGGDPDVFAARLAYHERNSEEELQLIELIRKQVAQILGTLKPEDFQRRGIHSESGPLTLETLLQRITGHIPHHVLFIDEKRKAMAQP
jgi:hypothetical protein